MHRKQTPDVSFVAHLIGQFPHCDQRILHAPGECEYCDKHPEWQALRHAWGIAFTGYEPDGKELPCPAMHARPEHFQAWIGNRVVAPNASSAEQLPTVFRPKSE